MLGTDLTVGDTARVCGVEREISSLVMIGLEEGRFLRRGANGRYTRRTTESIDP